MFSVLSPSPHSVALTEVKTPTQGSQDTEWTRVEKVPRAPSVDLPRAHRSLLAGTRKPIKAYLTYYAKTAGAANTAFPSGYNLQPNLDASWASWQNVFDEVKVLGADIYWNVEKTVTATVDPAQTCNTICVFDPSGTPNLTSVNQGLEYEDFTLVDLYTGYTGVLVSVPGCQTGNSRKALGRVHMKAKLAGGAVPSLGSANLLSTGMWRPTADANNYYWGGFLMYTAQGGLTSVLQTTAFVRMLCEFRTRR